MGKRILAVASAGGHWVQLQRLAPAFAGNEVRYVTTLKGLAAADGGPVAVVREGSRWDKLGLVLMLAGIAWAVLRFRPEVVITTGAAPGTFALRLGKLVGARTIWVDSIANAEELSLSARLARAHADLLLTQWPHLEGEEGAAFAGAVF